MLRTLEWRLQPVALNACFDRLKPPLQCAQSQIVYLTSYGFYLPAFSF